MHYVEYWVYRISGFEVDQGDKVLNWRKKIKDGHHDSNIFQNFLKNWCRLGIITTMQ